MHFKLLQWINNENDSINHFSHNNGPQKLADWSKMMIYVKIQQPPPLHLKQNHREDIIKQQNKTTNTALELHWLISFNCSCQSSHSLTVCQNENCCNVQSSTDTSFSVSLSVVTRCWKDVSAAYSCMFLADHSRVIGIIGKLEACTPCLLAMRVANTIRYQTMSQLHECHSLTH